MVDVGANWMIRSATVPIRTPTQFEITDLTKPCWPPPQAKNEAQAMKVTQTGSGRMVAVR